jgi:hypothetical protein
MPDIDPNAATPVSVKPNVPPAPRISDLDMGRVSEPVRVAAGLRDEKTYRERIKAVRRLSGSLNESEVAALNAFLRKPYSGQAGMSQTAYNAIKNEILNLFVSMKRPPESLVGDLLAMFRDRELDEAARDYALQHMTLYVKNRWERAIPANHPDWQQLRVGYDEALAQRRGSLAGTALIGLRQLAEQYDAVNTDSVKASALDVTNDDDCGTISRLTALQVCGQLGATEALPTARILAQTGDTAMLRGSAIAAIGYLGEEPDRELLQSFLVGTETRLHKPAETALRRLEMRLKN